MAKYQTIKINLENSNQRLGGSSYRLELVEDSEGPKGKAEFNGPTGSFSINVQGFARGFLEFIVDDLENNGFFRDNTQYESAFLETFDYNMNKKIGVHVVDKHGISKKKEITGDTNPYQDKLYEMLTEPFKRCLSKAPIGDFSGKELPHYEAFHKK